MALQSDLVGAGLYPLQAELLGYVIETTAGVGTTQAAGAIIGPEKLMTRGTTAGGATAFTLSASMPLASPFYFTNTTATAALLFPPTSGIINGGSANASVSVPQNMTLTIIRHSTTAFVVTLSAGTFSAISVSGLTTTDTLSVVSTSAFGGDATMTGIVGGDASMGVTGLAAAQGGDVALAGGASSTSANAGGAVTAVGGAPGLTGIGGAVTLTGAAGGATSGAGGAVASVGGAGAAGNAAGGAVTAVGGAGQGSASGGAVTRTGGAGGATGAGGAGTLVGGAGGATSGAGGAVSVTGGAGTNGNSAGGAASVVGGAGQGTASGGALTATAGASGAGATGTGGVVTISGGASLATNGNGGSVILNGGALAGTGKKGAVINRGTVTANPQGAPTAKTVTAAITAAELVTGIITTTGVTAPSVHQLPTGTLLLAELPNFAAGDSFDFSIINTGTGASDDATITVNTDVTIVGSPTVGALTDATIIVGSGRFRARYTGGVTWIVYRIA